MYAKQPRTSLPFRLFRLVLPGMRPRGKSGKPGKALLLLKVGLLETKVKAAIHLRLINGGLQYTVA